MDPRPNPFKHALAAGQRQIGLWLSIASPYANEAVGDAGFDWLLIDMEHTPTSIETALGQLQALAPYPGAAIVRPASNDAVRIKHLLDMGALTLLVPMCNRSRKPGPPSPRFATRRPVFAAWRARPAPPALAG
jgi:4-hydroxy-2-oxoheptanedioate aldolase